MTTQYPSSNYNLIVSIQLTISFVQTLDGRRFWNADAHAQGGHWIAACKGSSKDEVMKRINEMAYETFFGQEYEFDITYLGTKQSPHKWNR
jgi:hypothetical protein